MNLGAVTIIDPQFSGTFLSGGAGIDQPLPSITINQKTLLNQSSTTGYNPDIGLAPHAPDTDINGWLSNLSANIQQPGDKTRAQTDNMPTLNEKT